jgi:conjugal transfer pilus assembly protein TrbC
MLPFVNSLKKTRVGLFPILCLKTSLLAAAPCSPYGEKKMCAAPSKKPDDFGVGLSQPQEQAPSLFIFVSFSLPTKTLQAYAAEAEKIGGALVFRGLVQNSFVKTAARMKELGVPCQIDCTLFEKYNVKAVPTFILPGKDGSFDIVKGHTTLQSALEKMIKAGDLKVQAENLLTTLKDAA